MNSKLNVFSSVSRTLEFWISVSISATEVTIPFRDSTNLDFRISSLIIQPPMEFALDFVLEQNVWEGQVKLIVVVHEVPQMEIVGIGLVQ
jgi:hypothetical protein